jgi:hypothetical protein
MSKGLGRTQLSIRQVLQNNPDEAFTVEEMCVLVYDVSKVEKRHRVAVLRAGASVIEKLPDFDIGRWYGSPGCPSIFYNWRSFKSYIRARSKAERSSEKDLCKYRATELAEGGTWWLDFHKRIAELDNDEALKAKIKPYADKQEAQYAALLAQVQAFRR